MLGMGTGELLVILFIVLLLFGARRLPDLAAGLGGAVNSFRKALRGNEDDVKTLNAKPADEPVPAAKATESVKS